MGHPLLWPAGQPSQGCSCYHTGVAHEGMSRALSGQWCQLSTWPVLCLTSLFGPMDQPEPPGLGVYGRSHSFCPCPCHSHPPRRSGSVECTVVPGALAHSSALTTACSSRLAGIAVHGKSFQVSCPWGSTKGTGSERPWGDKEGWVSAELHGHGEGREAGGIMFHVR